MGPPSFAAVLSVYSKIIKAHKRREWKSLAIRDQNCYFRYKPRIEFRYMGMLEAPNIVKPIPALARKEE